MSEKQSSTLSNSSFYILYSFLHVLIVPFIMLRLLYRARKLPDYKKRLGERFGRVSISQTDGLWLHACSVGEFMAAIPLIKALRADSPELPILVTTTTPTGSKQVEAFTDEVVDHVYMPYDIPFVLRRFLKTVKPKCVVLMETELWPNLIRLLHQRDIPVILANGRLSKRSLRRYQYIKLFSKEMVKKLTKCLVQSKQDASRFLQLGVDEDNLEVTGSVKFDIELTDEAGQDAIALKSLLGDRPIWVAASTHGGEEEKVLIAHRHVLEKYPNALLILVPRHPDRFNDVENTVLKNGFKLQKRSERNPVKTDTSVFLGNTMGEMMVFYSASDVAFVGGSLIKHGGHNPLEGAACKKPLISGKHVFNFAAIYQDLIEQQGVVMVDDEKELTDTIIRLLQDRDFQQVLSQSAYSYLKVHQGASYRHVQAIKPYL